MPTAPKTHAETTSVMTPIVKAWVNAYLQTRAEDDVPEMWMAAYRENYPEAAGEDLDEEDAPPPARLSAAWRFYCNCTHIWDDGGAPPRWDAKVNLSYTDELFEIELDYNPNFREYLYPQPTYRRILQPTSPFVFSEDQDEPVSELIGPDVLDLEARLEKVGVTLLPDEGMGGDTDLTVDVKEDGTVTVEINIRRLPGGDAVQYVFAW